MRMRIFLAYTHLLNFLVGVIVISYVLLVSWGSLESWLSTLYLYYLVLGFCGVVIACWIAIDGKQIEHCADNIRDLEQRIWNLEKKINRIKTTTRMPVPRETEIDETTRLMRTHVRGKNP